jgi:predicted ABC-type exoprotein transport system permease subunit
MFHFGVFEIFVSSLFLLVVLLSGSIDNQWFTFRKQILKKSIMMIVGACLFLVAAAQALPLFFGVGA